MTAKNGWFAMFAASLIIAMVLLLAGTPSVAANDQSSAANAEVKIDNFSFGPQTVTVAVGATVTWINHDDIPHTVVSTDGLFNSMVGTREALSTPKVRNPNKKSSSTSPRRGTYPSSARSIRR